MWIVVYRPPGADREQRSTPFLTRAEAETQAVALQQRHDVLRIELAGLGIGQSYERRDGRTAVVTEADPTGQSGRLRFSNGDSEWIKWGDVRANWRLYESCPTCRGTGQQAVVHPVGGEQSRRQDPPTCPTCHGAKRIYPVPGIVG
jgi:hypothetical protein